MVLPGAHRAGQGPATTRVGHEVEERGDPLFLQVGHEEEGGFAEVDANDHGAVVDVLELGGAPVVRLHVRSAEQHPDFRVHDLAPDRVDDWAGEPELVRLEALEQRVEKLEHELLELRKRVRGG